MADASGPFAGATSELLRRLNPADPGFVADPYPVLGALRESARATYDEARRQWVIARFADVADALRNQRLGRTYRHRGSDHEFRVRLKPPGGAGPPSNDTSDGRCSSSSRPTTRASAGWSRERSLRGPWRLWRRRSPASRRSISAPA